MFQQTKNKSVDSNNNRNPNVQRGRERGQRGFGGHIDRGGCRDHRNKPPIAKSLFEEKLKSWCLYKLTITEGSHQITQLKKYATPCPFYAPTKISSISRMNFITIRSWSKPTIIICQSNLILTNS